MTRFRLAMAFAAGLATGLLVIGAVLLFGPRAHAQDLFWFDACGTAERVSGVCRVPPRVGWDGRGPMPAIDVSTDGHVTFRCPALGRSCVPAFDDGWHAGYSDGLDDGIAATWRDFEQLVVGDDKLCVVLDGLVQPFPVP